MIGQRKLPAQDIYVRCKSAAEAAKTIKTMVIRGAPAIGVAAAMGIALGRRKSSATGTQTFAAEFRGREGRATARWRRALGRLAKLRRRIHEKGLCGIIKIQLTSMPK